MCLAASSSVSVGDWNWDGDVILHRCIVPSGRPVVGSRHSRRQYPIDVREFLVTERNEMMRQTLGVDVREYAKAHGADWDLFQSRRPRSFDHRAQVIAGYVADEIRYLSRRGRDPWQFPDETLFLKSGDCEDRAFLIASLLLASGISGYNVRVALGKVRAREDGRTTRHDHAWVMYKNEAGRWELIEPLQFASSPVSAPRRGRRRAKTPSPPTGRLGYFPQFLFNADHLWQVDRPGVPTTDFEDTVSRSWRRMNPKFVGQVHQGIVHAALLGVAPAWVIQALDRQFLFSGSITIDRMDLPGGYDPRDHFDNGYVAEGWQRVFDRLRQFRQNPSDLTCFGQAAHGIADFYAHTSYVHFAKLISPADLHEGRAMVCEPSNLAGCLLVGPAYTSAAPAAGMPPFNLVSGGFTTNSRYWKGTAVQAAQQWAGRLISGRYAQRSDSHGVVERITWIPDELERAPDFFTRGALPHHNEVAVDEDPGTQPGKARFSNRLYRATDPVVLNDRSLYFNQFRWRRRTAIEHIRLAYLAQWPTSGLPDK